MRRRALLALALAGAACTDRVVLPPVKDAAGWRTEVLMLGAGDRLVDRVVFDTADPAPVADLAIADDLDRAEAWLLREPPAVWGLSIGRSEGLVGEAPPTDAARAFVASLDDDRPTWSEGPPLWRDALRVSPTSPIACAESGGCFASATEVACTTPCPAPAAPTPPAAPSFTPRACPAGWAPSPRGTACRPWDGQPPPECAAGTAAYTSRSACAPIGPACPPAGTWAEAGAAPAVYVRAGAPGGGDGSRGAPFDTLDRALAAGAAQIVLDAGTYTAASPIAGVRVIGRCVGATTLSGAPLLLGEGAALTGLRVDGAFDASGAVSLTGVEVAVGGISWVRGRATLEDVRIRATGAADTLLVAAPGASLTARQLALDGSAGAAINADHAAAVDLEDVAFARASDGALLIGVTGASRVRRVASVSVVRETVVAFGGQLAVEDAYALGGGGALVRGDDGAIVTAAGLVAEAGLSPVLDLARAAELTAEDVEAVSLAEGVRQVGVIAVFDATARVSRVRVRDTGGRSVSVIGGELTLSDLEVRDSRPFTPRIGDREAVLVTDSGRLNLSRADLAGGPGAAVVFSANANGRLDDLRIADTGNCAFCGGLCMTNEAKVTGARVALTAVRGGGVRAFRRSTLTLSELSIDGVSTSVMPVCGDDAGQGRGLMADGDSDVTVDRFDIRGAASAGVAAFAYTFNPARLSLSNGAVRDNPIGVLFSGSGYDVRRVLVGVELSANRVPIQSVSE